MLRKWLGKLLKYEDELETLKHQVELLSWDEPYGMLTRPAFLALCHNLPAGRYPLGFLDLDALGEMNLRYGYTTMDQRVRKLFQGWRHPGEVVARWYSGDEIVLLFPLTTNPQARMRDLHSAAGRAGLGFTGASGFWGSRHTQIEPVVSKLADQTRQKKILLGTLAWETN